MKCYTIDWNREPYRSAKTATGCRKIAFEMIECIIMAKEMGIDESEFIKYTRMI